MGLMASAKGTATIELLAIGVPIVILAGLAFYFVKTGKKPLYITVNATSTTATFSVTNASTSSVQFYPIIILNGLFYNGATTTIGSNATLTATVSYPSVPTGTNFQASCDDPNGAGISNIIVGNTV